MSLQVIIGHNWSEILVISKCIYANNDRLGTISNSFCTPPNRLQRRFVRLPLFCNWCYHFLTSPRIVHRPSFGRCTSYTEQADKWLSRIWSRGVLSIIPPMKSWKGSAFQFTQLLNYTSLYCARRRYNLLLTGLKTLGWRSPQSS